MQFFIKRIRDGDSTEAMLKTSIAVYTIMLEAISSTAGFRFSVTSGRSLTQKAVTRRVMFVSAQKARKSIRGCIRVR